MRVEYCIFICCVCLQSIFNIITENVLMAHCVRACRLMNIYINYDVMVSLYLAFIISIRMTPQDSVLLFLFILSWFDWLVEMIILQKYILPTWVQFLRKIPRMSHCFLFCRWFIFSLHKLICHQNSFCLVRNVALHMLFQ